MYLHKIVQITINIKIRIPLSYLKEENYLVSNGLDLVP